jgi:hypothetical protein
MKYTIRMGLFCLCFGVGFPALVEMHHAKTEAVGGTGQKVVICKLDSSGAPILEGRL